MKKYLLLLLIGICAASCDSYTNLRLEPKVEAAWEEYNPYLWDVYNSYFNYYDMDSVPFFTEIGDTIMVGLWAVQGIEHIDDAFCFARTNLTLYCGEYMDRILAKIELLWTRVTGKMELGHYNQIGILDCNSSLGSYSERFYDDYLEFSNEEGDVILLQKNVGIVRITCHDGRSWMPAR